MTMFEHDEISRRDASCHRCLRKYGSRVAPLQVTPLGNSGGFSGALIWRVATEHGDFALRRWPNPALPGARIRGLHRLLEYLDGEGLRCLAVPRRAQDGTTVVSEDGHYWQLEPWLPGTADFSLNPRPERLRAAMQTLAEWHLAAERYRPDAASSEWFACQLNQESPAVRERLQILDRIEKRVSVIEAAISQSAASPVRDLSLQMLQFIRRGRGKVAEQLQAVRAAIVRLHPCLRDVWHDHLLFTADTVTGVIDPSACRSENVACDLSRLIGSLVLDDRARWGFALAEYQRYRALTISELQLVQALDCSGVLLSGWTWLEWIYAEHRHFADSSTVLQRLSLLRQRIESVVDGESEHFHLVLP